jgi:DNA polymerase II small subunit/DNA polymerase delta subunit B
VDYLLKAYYRIFRCYIESKMRKLKEKLDEVSESLEVENEKREIVKTEKNRVQKIVEELRESKEESFSTTFKSVRN